jgi:hypothetical protein
MIELTPESVLSLACWKKGGGGVSASTRRRVKDDAVLSVGVSRRRQRVGKIGTSCERRASRSDQESG